MSAMPYTETKQGGGWMLKLFVIAIIVFAAFKLLPLVFGNVDVQVAYSDHAGEHDEADAIRCSNDVLAVWVNKSCERYNVLKQLDDGRVGDQVVQPCKRFGFKMVLEITSYVIGGGTLDEAIDVMKAKGCTQVWP
jgi:hypothetical protein